MVFVDSMVIVDVITEDPRWRCWSEEQRRRMQNQGARPPSAAEWQAGMVEVRTRGRRQQSQIADRSAAAHQRQHHFISLKRKATGLGEAGCDHGDLAAPVGLEDQLVSGRNFDPAMPSQQLFLGFEVDLVEDPERNG
jgi:hypothetical protein